MSTSRQVLDSLIAYLVKDIEDKSYWYEEARKARSNSRMETCAQQRLGLEVALGRALGHAEGIAGEDEFEALRRALDYLKSR